MDVAGLVRAALPWVVAALVLGDGLNASFEDLRGVLRQPGRLGRSLFAMFLVGPLLAAAIAAALPVGRVVAVTLVVLGACPGAPLLGRTLTRRGGDPSFVYGFLALAALVSVVTVPATIRALEAVLGVRTALAFPTIAWIVGRTFLLPLVLGMGLRRLFPALPRRVGEVLQWTAWTVVVLVALLLVVRSFDAIRGLGAPSLGALAVFAVGLLACGYALGGPSDLDRRTLAVACAARHPGVALPVVVGLTSAATLPVVLAYLLVVIALALLVVLGRRVVRPPPVTSAHA